MSNTEKEAKSSRTGNDKGPSTEDSEEHNTMVYAAIVLKLIDYSLSILGFEGLIECATWILTLIP